MALFASTSLDDGERLHVADSKPSLSGSCWAWARRGQGQEIPWISPLAVCLERLIGAPASRHRYALLKKSCVQPEENRLCPSTGPICLVTAQPTLLHATY